MRTKELALVGRILWYDAEIDKREFRATLWKARHLSTREAEWSNAVIAIREAIDNYAHVITGNWEYFWNRPHSIGR